LNQKIPIPMKNVHAFKLVLTLALLSQACDPQTVDPAGRINVSAVPGNIETAVGQGPGGFGYDGDGGLSTAAKIGWVVNVEVDQDNNLYIADGSANVIRKVNASTGVITTVAGNGVSGYSGDGGAATGAQLDVPLGTAVDASGNILIVDTGNSSLRKVSSTDGKISTIAGSFSTGYDGDGGPASGARFWNLYDVDVDDTGNIYLADAGNNAIRMIEKSTGTISTIAGLGPDDAGYSGDSGPATLAKLNYPRALAVDDNGNVYVADSFNHVVRKISNGVITTIAGNGTSGYSGDGGPAINSKLFYPTGIAVGNDGHVYISDAGNSVIRKIDASTGNISTIGGNGVPGYSGDGGPATAAKISDPWGITVDSHGNVFIADSQNAAIRVITK
jgi:trimeric autotransporter adhesin